MTSAAALAAERGQSGLLWSTLSALTRHLSMSYLKDLGVALEAKLAALPQEARDELIAFVKDAVLTSYKNGLRDAATPRPSTDGATAPRRQRPAPREKRHYQKS